jgi:hypothetical protein
MATYDLDRTELNHLLTPNIDPSIRTAILDYVFNGVTPASHVALEDGKRPHRFGRTSSLTPTR